MRNILICGSTGFIGRNLAEYFSRKKEFKVYGTYFGSSALNNKKIESLKVDLTSQKQVDQVTKNMDIIIHAAATTSGAKDVVESPFLHVTDNAIMNSILLRSAYKNKVKNFIFFSCSVMYQSSEKPQKEEDFSESDDIYKNYFGVGWTKIYTEKMCEFYSGLGVTQHLVIRHSNVYGPYDKFDLKKSHVFGATVNKVLDDSKSTILVWGDGGEKRDLIYIDDLVEFVEVALATKIKERFCLVNIGSGTAFSIKDLINKIIIVTGKKKELIFDKTKPTIKTSVSLDSTKANRLFGWEPKTPLLEGIRKTVDWYTENILRK